MKSVKFAICVCVLICHSLLICSDCYRANGILVEGVDCDFKSEVCKVLQDRLAERGMKIQLADNYLSKNILLTFLLEKSKISESTKDKIFYHACAGILDHAVFQKHSNTFYIYNRDWLSKICWVEFFFPKKPRIPNGRMTSKECILQWNIYLHLPYDLLQKHRMFQASADSNHQKISIELDQFAKYTDLCLSKIPKDGTWTIIHVESLDPSEIASRILEICKL